MGMLINFLRTIRQGIEFIADRPGLESVSCACYRAIWRAYDNMGIRL